ncbi:MAG: hypothetical protein P4L87_20675 [Formivibrio sp.]|nr:hypothetical protein [Formivibrio sp.]
MDTLDIVLRQSKGALLVPLKTTADLIGLEAQTLRNQLSEGRCAFLPIKKKNKYERTLFDARDIAHYIDARRSAGTPEQKRGRPTIKERRQAQEAGLTVQDWRRHNSHS